MSYMLVIFLTRVLHYFSGVTDMQHLGSGRLAVDEDTTEISRQVGCNIVTRKDVDVLSFVFAPTLKSIAIHVGW